MGMPDQYNTNDKAVLLPGEDRLQYTPNPPIQTRRRLWKNFLILCIAFLLTFTAFNSIQNLQSTLNHVAGLGVVSLACANAGMIVACLFAPAYVAAVGPKWGVVTGMVAHVVFVSANFYPSFFTLVPASVILGLAGASQSTGSGVYLTQLAIDYAGVVQEESAVYISRLYGIFFFFLQCSQVIGNLVSSFVFFNNTNKDDTNMTNTSQDCGAKFCQLNTDNSSSSSSITPPQHLVYLLLGIYASCSVAGCFLFTVFADNRAQPETEEDRSPKALATATFQIHKNTLDLDDNVQESTTNGFGSVQKGNSTYGYHTIIT
jgi:hypothetical protein